MGDGRDDGREDPRSLSHPSLIPIEALEAERSSTHGRRWDRIIWAGPWSLFGLLLSLLFRRRYVSRGVILAEGASWPRRLGWRYRAITFGHVVLAVGELDAATFEHELVHVRQYERWGPLFIPLYLCESLRAVVRREHPYRDNRFEVEANRSRH